ncbi:MAG: VOC family protein [Candidatus Obscuribacterales bacterium]|nr:VOC family protein [Cyanobacteria bacterium SZAS LIN-5]RTL38391.1 MAG: VOC family protein [Candidatus Melainabacteria bacterium]
MTDTVSKTKPAAIDHIAIPVTDVDASVKWYTSEFGCTIEYQDDTWAFLKFENIKLALVVKHQHPPHLAFVSPRAESYGELKTHRDGTRSVYIKDPAGNAVEIVAEDSLPKSGG